MFDNTFIIFDTEYTSWEGSVQRNWSEEWEEMELVKLSAIKVLNTGSTLEIIDKIDLFCKPLINPILSDYFKNLTSITQEEVDSLGLDIVSLTEKFREFCNGNLVYSYGNDFGVIELNFKLRKMDISNFHDFSTRMNDLHPYYEKMGIDTSKYTSGELYRALDIEPDVDASVHDSAFDVYSLYLVLRKLIYDK